MLSTVRRSVPCLVSLSLLALSACGGGGGTTPPPVVQPPAAPTLPTGTDQGGTGNPTDPLTLFVNTATFIPIAHQGLESVTLSGGSANLINMPDANPSIQLTRTTTGFDLTETTRFDTRPGSRHGSGSNFNLGTNQYVTCSGNASCVGGSLSLSILSLEFNGGAANTLSYSTYGTWYVRESLTIVRTQTVFATGVPSTSTQVPTSGSGTFTGGASGFVVIDYQDGSKFKGIATLNADFATRTISGGITGITATTRDGAQTRGPLANIALSGGTISGVSFTGVATAGTIAGAATDISGMTGQFGGQFYGPNAQEAAGSFALTKSGLSVIGAFGVKR